MLTVQQIADIKREAHIKFALQDEDTHTADEIFARAIESAVHAEYADVPPEKFKALYRAAAAETSLPQIISAMSVALSEIDNGTYNPNIGGEE